MRRFIRPAFLSLLLGAGCWLIAVVGHAMWAMSLETSRPSARAVSTVKTFGAAEIREDARTLIRQVLPGRRSADVSPQSCPESLRAFRPKSVRVDQDSVHLVLADRGRWMNGVIVYTEIPDWLQERYKEGAQFLGGGSGRGEYRLAHGISWFWLKRREASRQARRKQEELEELWLQDMDNHFRHHLIDTTLPVACYAQTALADLNNDGRLEYLVGQQYGTIYWYQYHAPDQWTRHVLGEDSPSDVGGCVLDVDGDGWLDFVAGGAWYRNRQDPEQPFERIVFDADLRGVHDVVAGDIDGDGRPEVVTMSDQNSLRWYKIPDDPRKPWPKTDIGAPVHAGASLGDVDGDGRLDVVRTNVWFRNVKGDGTQWVEHEIGPNTPPPADFQPSFAFDATKSVVRDMNGDGKNDLVFTDAEIPGGKVWWMENVDGSGTRWVRHEVTTGDETPRRGAYHSLYVGDMDGDGDLDLVSAEMEAVGGDGNPRWYVWENVDGVGGQWKEHVILDANLGGHELVVGDVTGNGRPDLLSKPWRPRTENAVGGKMFVVFLENVSE